MSAVLLLVVATAAALLHLVPYWHAARSAPAGWEFTGNIHSSPDFAEYRVWMRQTAREGGIVGNRFTSEPNRPHLPVAFYQLLGALSRVSGLTPEWTMNLFGAALAAGLVLLLAGLIRAFLPESMQAWWVLGALLLGGGVGAHLKFARALVNWWQGAGSTAAAGAALGDAGGDPRVTWLLFEDYRGSYLFSTLFDTHFLMAWFVAVAALVAFHRALTAPSPSRSVVAAVLFGTATVLHVHEGVILVAIVWSCLALWWAKRLPLRRALVDGALCTAVAGTILVYFVYLQHRSGLPAPEWRALAVLPSILLLAHPVAWGLILWGVGRYWRSAGPHETFLLGWALGCLLLILSAPFYPYSDRGMTVLQVPLYLIAGTIYFRHRAQVTRPALAVAILLMGATPLWIFQKVWRAGAFSPEMPHKWLSADARATVDELRRRAGPDDLLLAEPWQARWLAPEFPGRHYVAHFFLTVDFQRKSEEYEAFCSDSGSNRRDFLSAHGIRFVYLLERCAPLASGDAAALRMLHRDRYGTLLERVAKAGS